MRYMIRTAFFALALLFSSFSSAQALWTKAEYGMTVGQVKTAFPGAVDSPKSSQLKSGARALLTLPNVQVGGASFSGNFYFLSDKLVQVTLSLDNPGNFDSVLRTVETIEELLRAKYGREIQRELKRGRFLNQASLTFMSGPTNVSVLAMGVGDSKAILNVNYQLRVSHEAEKL